MQQVDKGHERKRRPVKASCPGRELTKPIGPLSVWSLAGTVQNRRVLFWKRVTVCSVPKAECQGFRPRGAARPCHLGPPSGFFPDLYPHQCLPSHYHNVAEERVQLGPSLEEASTSPTWPPTWGGAGGWWPSPVPYEMLGGRVVAAGEATCTLQLLCQVCSSHGVIVRTNLPVLFLHFLAKSS